MADLAPPSQPSKAPYLPTAAGLGGQPATNPDVIVCSIFLALFVASAAVHMTLLRVNLSRGHKFILSGLLFGFCMARITALVLRIVWSQRHTIPIAIASQVLVAAGVILLFIVNLIFTQRIIRAQHPHFGWQKPLSIAFKVYYASIVLTLIALITCTVQSFYTLSKNTRRIDRDVQLFGSTYFTVSAFLPIPMVLLSLMVPRTTPTEKFGEGRFRTKIYVLLFSAAILTLGSAFRTGIAYVPRPTSRPAWYHSRACFYIFNFAIEITVVILYAIARVDKRFWVPDASHGPGDYSRKPHTETAAGLESANPDEEVFEDAPKE